jgi:hypothetical protein
VNVTEWQVLLELGEGERVTDRLGALTVIVLSVLVAEPPLLFDTDTVGV